MNLEAILNELAERAKTDAAFRKELEKDPEGVLLRETGMTVHELRQDVEFLSDDDLAMVAAGRGGEEEEQVVCDHCREPVKASMIDTHRWFLCKKRPRR